MHILFIAGWCDPFGDFTKEHCYAIAKYCRVSYIYVEFNKTSAFKFPGIKHESYIENSVDMHFARISSPLRRFGIYEWLVKRTYSRLIKKLKNKDTISLCHMNVRTPVTELLLEMPTFKKTPFVVTEHSSFYHTGIYNIYRGEGLEREKQRIRKWFSDPRITNVLPVSNQLGNVLSQDFGVSQEKIIKVPNVAAEQFTYCYLVPSETIRLSLVAMWSYPKNPMLFVRALSLLSPTILNRLEIVWVGEGDLLDEVKNYQEKYLPNLKVKFTGIIRQRLKVAKILQSSDLLVHPSDAENLPCIIIESLCCGTPVLSNKINGITELIDEHNGILSPAGDAKLFSESLQRFIVKLPFFNRELIAKEAAMHYSAEMIGQQIFDIYKKGIIAYEAG